MEIYILKRYQEQWAIRPAVRYAQVIQRFWSKEAALEAADIMFGDRDVVLKVHAANGQLEQERLYPLRSTQGVPSQPDPSRPDEMLQN